MLIVDDDFAIRDSLSEYLQSEGWETLTAASAESALETIAAESVDIVITDVRMPGIDGIRFTARLREIAPDIDVLIATGHSNESTAIEALKAGAFDFFCKPIDVKQVSAALRRTRRFRDTRLENMRLRAVIERLSATGEKPAFIGTSPASHHLVRQVEKLAQSPTTTVLLTGESGVGKEVIARLIHDMSCPASSPFVALNCGGVAESRLEAELFGRDRGAYTGADRTVPGIFEMAVDGTVLLDEIGEMSPHAQSRLLRVLENRSIRRLGGTNEIPIRTTRIIAATNKDLEALARDGGFRQDLLYRILVAKIDIPPLRDRTGDILPLARHFLDQFMVQSNKKLSFSKAAERALISHAYPGNARELRNIIERAVVFGRATELSPADLGLAGAGALPRTNNENSDGDYGETLDLAFHERNLIREAVRRHATNHCAAARALGISPQALYRKVEKYGPLA